MYQQISTFLKRPESSPHSPQNFGEKQRICRQHQAGRDEVNCVSPAVEAPPSSPQPSRPGRCRGGAAVRRAREHGSGLQLAGQRHEDRGVACWASHMCAFQGFLPCTPRWQTRPRRKQGWGCLWSQSPGTLGNGWVCPPQRSEWLRNTQV